VPDLAGVRDADRLAELPEVERAVWRQFWPDVVAQVARAVTVTAASGPGP
jgi:hypothetical protein